jgi:hypothetical protein
MVEVFKTNVEHRDHANVLIEQIHESFTNYNANFDLEDCDRILRVKCATEPIQSLQLIKLLREFGFYAEVLEDDFPSVGQETTYRFIH